MIFDSSKIEGFEWDHGNLEHIKIHNVSHRECEDAFLNKPFIVNEDKTHSKIEERFQALGKANNGRLLFISFTIRNNKVRVVSARDQNRKERVRLNKIGGENL
jgi:uncharacterized protein